MTRERAYARLVVAILLPDTRGDDRREVITRVEGNLRGCQLCVTCEECWPAPCDCIDGPSVPWHGDCAGVR